MFIGKRVNALAKNVFAAALSATLVLGLVPSAAFATASENAGGGFSVENPEAATVSNSVEGAEGAETAEDQEIQKTNSESLDSVDDAVFADDSALVAAHEATKAYFLATVLETTRTVPIVSAKLPIDTGALVDSAESGENSSQEEAEGDDDSDESDSGSTVAEASTVIGSFMSDGITYAVEPGGESVAVVAVDYAKLPSNFIETQTIVLPGAVSADSIDFYSVTRIADGAFASLTTTEESAPSSVAAPAGDEMTSEELSSHKDSATSEMSSVDIISTVVSLTEGSTAYQVEPVDSDSTLVGAEKEVEASSADEASTDGESGPVPRIITAKGNISAQSEEVSPDDEACGITTVAIPESVAAIEKDAFTGAEALLFITVNIDNSNYASYDGCLYTADFTSLLLIPEGRQEGVRIHPKTESIDSDVVSHCAFVTTLFVNADSPLLASENELYNAAGEVVETVVSEIDPVDNAAEIATAKETSQLNLNLQVQAENASQSETFIESAAAYSADTDDGSKAVAKAFLAHDLTYYGDVGASDYETAMNRIIDNKQSRVAGKQIWSCIYAVIFDKGRVIVLGRNGYYYPFGLTTEGGIGGIQYSYSMDANAPRYNVPCGPYGVCPTQDFYVWIYGTDQYAAAAYMGNTWNGTSFVGGFSFDEALTVDMGTATMTRTPGQKIWSSIDGLIFYNGRILVLSHNKAYYPFGLTATGGVGRVQYSYDAAGTIKYDVPYGPNGFRPNANFWVWVYPDTTAVPKAYVGKAFDGYGNVGGFDYETALTKDLGTKEYHCAAGSQIWSTIYRVIFTGSRLLCCGGGYRYYPFGLTTTGGIGRVQYSYDAAGTVKYDVPCGPDGFCPSGEFWLWISEATGFESQIIVWNGNGGAWKNGATQQMSDVKVSTVGQTGPSSGLPTKAGMVFNGWSKTETALSGEMEVHPTGFVTYYATWRYYAITLDRGSGTDGDAGPLYYKGGTSALFSDSVCTAAKTKVNIPVWRGHTFQGYFTAANGGDKIIDANGTVQTATLGTNRWTADATLYAQWVETTYPVTFEKGAGTSTSTWNPATGPFAYESGTFTAPSAADLTRRGYTLVGWSTSTSPANADNVTTGKLTVKEGDSTTVAALYEGSSTVPSPIKLYPVWRVNVYTIALSRNGGTYDPTSLSALTAKLAADASSKAKLENDTLTYTVLTPAFALPGLEKTGWTFGGWSADGGATMTPNVAIDPSDAAFALANLSYAACWTQSEYLIAYYQDDAKTKSASWKEGASVTTAFGVDGPATMTIPDPVRKGWTFTGWSGPGLAGSSNLGGVTVDLSGLITASLPKAPAIALEYVAHWTQDTYTVTYVLNDAADNYAGAFASGYAGFSGTAPSEQADGTYADAYRYDETGTASVLMLPNKTGDAYDLTRPGYLFAGWVRTDDGSNDSVSSIDPKSSAEDMTFQALWNPVASVALPATTTPQTIEFVLDRATGSLQEVVEGRAPQALKVSSTTPVDCELSVRSEAGDFDIADLFEPREGASASDIADLVAAMGFVFAADGSGLADAKAASLSFLHKGAQAGSLKVKGSEQFASKGAGSLSTVDVRGTLKLAQKRGSSFDDIAVDTSKISIKSTEELPQGPLTFANIIWTVSLPSAS